MIDSKDLENQLQKALRECASLREKNERLKKLLGLHPEDNTPTRKPSTLFLAMPISWRGTLQQYVGRLHRLHDNKRVVQVYDYIDIHVPTLMRMYKKRVKGYEAIGYSMQNGPENSKRQSDEYEYLQIDEA